MSGDQTRMMDQYIVANVDVNNSFNAMYAGTIADLNYIRQNAFKQNNPNHAGIAKILQAYAFSIITDAWGDVPYTEAMKGVANVQPGVKLVGVINQTDNASSQKGELVLLKVRDKTLKIYTESPDFIDDFNKVILSSLTFVP